MERRLSIRKNKKEESEDWRLEREERHTFKVGWRLRFGLWKKMERLRFGLWKKILKDGDLKIWSWEDRTGWKGWV